MNIHLLQKYSRVEEPVTPGSFCVLGRKPEKNGSSFLLSTMLIKAKGQTMNGLSSFLPKTEAA
jgi:hypothetical protein